MMCLACVNFELRESCRVTYCKLKTIQDDSMYPHWWFFNFDHLDTGVFIFYNYGVIWTCKNPTGDTDIYDSTLPYKSKAVFKIFDYLSNTYNVIGNGTIQNKQVKTMVRINTIYTLQTSGCSII